MALAVFPLIVALVGLVMFLISKNANVIFIGKVLFAAGVLALCFALSSHTVRIGTAAPSPSISRLV